MLVIGFTCAPFEDVGGVAPCITGHWPAGAGGGGGGGMFFFNF